jgi:hypothetical protein
MKEDPNLVANGRFYYLVDLERFHYLVDLERFHCLVDLERFYCLVANGRFHCLVANGRRRNNTFLPLLIFSEQILLKPSIFSFDLKVLLTMVLDHIYAFSSFSLTYKLQPRILM